MEAARYLTGRRRRAMQGPVPRGRRWHGPSGPAGGCGIQHPAATRAAQPKGQDAAYKKICAGAAPIDRFGAAPAGHFRWSIRFARLNSERCMRWFPRWILIISPFLSTALAPLLLELNTRTAASVDGLGDHCRTLRTGMRRGSKRAARYGPGERSRAPIRSR